MFIINFTQTEDYILYHYNKIKNIIHICHGLNKINFNIKEIYLHFYENIQLYFTDLKVKNINPTIFPIVMFMYYIMVIYNNLST